jgi:predicted cobalt transporter CbtA
MIPHIWGIAGIVNTASAVGLLIFRPNPFAGATLTPEQFASVLPAAYSKYQREIVYYRVSLVLMAIGFFLQLIDILVA